VVGEEDGDILLPLESAQGAEDGRDLTCAVFVEARDEPNERIENEQPGSVKGDGAAQPVEVAGVVKAELGDVEQEEGDTRKVEAPGACDAFEAKAQVGWRVLGTEEENGTWVWGGEAAERRRSRSDGQGELRGDPGFEGLGRSTEQAHRRVGEEWLDKPAVFIRP
jgi:hypothetical protein